MADFLKLFRPTQWVKNAFVLAPLVFSNQFTDPVALGCGFLAFVAFCMASSSAYVVNDVVDAERDREHPLKRMRPVAAGRISKRSALVAAGLLTLGGLGLSLVLGLQFTAFATAYVVLQFAYSAFLKKIVFIDAVSISAGFVLRVAAGVVAVDARMSGWMFVSTFLLALFLALAKRRQELAMLGEAAGRHRSVLSHYRQKPLDFAIFALAAATVAVYADYSFSSEVAARLGTDRLFLTLPFVVFGVFRYLFLVYRRAQGDDPTAALLGDRLLQASVLLWGLTAIAVLSA